MLITEQQLLQIFPNAGPQAGVLLVRCIAG